MSGASEKGVAALEDLRVVTADKQQALIEDVTLELFAGERVGLIGESGSGKSTLAHALMGLIPFVPSLTAEGVVRLGSFRLAVRDRGAFGPVRGRRAAMIAQDPMATFNPHRRLGPQVAEVLRLIHGQQRREADGQVLALFATVGLKEPELVSRCYPHELSGGMLQRAAIAMALAAKSELLIADEPTTALDVTTQAQIMALLRHICAERQVALLFISHDLALCAQLTDRTVVLFAGEIVEQGPTRTLLGRPRHPYTAGLLAAAKNLPHAEATVPEDHKPVSGGCTFASRCPRVLRVCRHIHPPLATLTPGHALRCFNPTPLPAAERQDG